MTVADDSSSSGGSACAADGGRRAAAAASSSTSSGRSPRVSHVVLLILLYQSLELLWGPPPHLSLLGGTGAASSTPLPQTAPSAADLLAAARAAAAAAPPELATTPDGLLPYEREGLDLRGLIATHQAWQEAALRAARLGAARPPRAICVDTFSDYGLGNRIPSVVTGFLLALLTRRAFLLHSTLHEHLELPLPAAWEEHAPLYADGSSCEMELDAMASLRLADPGLTLCGDGSADVISYLSVDWDAPFLQVNPALAPAIARLFPDGELFHPLAVHLLSAPTPAVAAALAPYLPRASRCAVGVHMRGKKGPLLESLGARAALDAAQFAGIARALARGGGGVFLASDSAELIRGVAALLGPGGDGGGSGGGGSDSDSGAGGGLDVWWSELTVASVDNDTTPEGDPGTDLSAIVDLLLLSKCREVVVTPSSSFGIVAAGLAGVQPVFAALGRASGSAFVSPLMWKSVTCEPCCTKLAPSMAAALGKHLTEANDTALLRALLAHPLYYYFQQCHY